MHPDDHGYKFCFHVLTPIACFKHRANPKLHCKGRCVRCLILRAVRPNIVKATPITPTETINSLLNPRSISVRCQSHFQLLTPFCRLAELPYKPPILLQKLKLMCQFVQSAIFFRPHQQRITVEQPGHYSCWGRFLDTLKIGGGGLENLPISKTKQPSSLSL